MIGALRGTVLSKDLHTLIIDASGVGYKVSATTDTILDAVLGEPVFLWTYLAVRESALDLYGFSDKETLSVFELLIGISGIGPKTAIGILNVATPEMLRQAVANDDTSYLTRVSGIGKKNAEKIVLELRDKLVVSESDKERNMEGLGDAMEALVSLGYSERDARAALKHVPKTIENTSERLKLALKHLSSPKQ